MGTQTFSYTGSAQNFVVPAGVTSLTVECWGAEGGQGGQGNANGKGGRIKATVTVTPGETLQVWVGRQGSSYNSGVPYGGWPDGGVATDLSANRAFNGGSGGGSTSVRRTPYGTADRLVTAGGGGGSPGGGHFNPAIGGGGGGYPAGQAGGCESGTLCNTAGTATTAGTGPSFSSPAGNASGAVGGNGTDDGNGGSGGGGGLFGGGGGAVHNVGAPGVQMSGGAGGSSGLAASGVTLIDSTTNDRTGDGQAIITWTDPPPSGSGTPALAPVTASGSGVVSPAVFNYTGGPQYYVVPPGATAVIIELDGAPGGTVSGNAGGKGWHLKATVPATPGEVLQVNVGGAGGIGGGGTGGGGGWNGGGGGGGGTGVYAYGGGGAADVRRNSPTYGLADRIITAAGGGGAGNSGGATGGDGGVNGTNGGNGSHGGTGATPTTPGTGGSAPVFPGGNGVLGVGGSSPAGGFAGGGGGGGGLQGGGAGSSGQSVSNEGGGGGGGSSGQVGGVTVTESNVSALSAARITITLPPITGSGSPSLDSLIAGPGGDGGDGIVITPITASGAVTLDPLVESGGAAATLVVVPRPAGGPPLGTVYGKMGGVWRVVPSAPTAIVPVTEGIFGWALANVPYPAVEAFAHWNGAWVRVWARAVTPGTGRTPTLSAVWNTSAYDVTAVWDASAQAATYEVEWTVGGVVSVVAVTPRTSTVNAPPGTAVSARVRALNSYGHRGAWGPATSGTANVGSPTVTAGGGGTALLTLSWTQPTGAPASPTGLAVEVSTDAGASWLPVSITMTGTRAGTVSSPGGYDVLARVRESVSGALGTSPWGVSGSVSLLPPAPALVLDNPPDLTILATATSPLAGATLAIQVDSGAGFGADTAVTSGVATTLGPYAFGTVVTVRAKAVHNTRTSAWTTVTLTVSGLSAPPAPTVVSSTFSSVTLSVPAVTGAESYRVEVLSETGTSVATFTSATPSTIVATGLAHDTRYQFRVRAERPSASAVGPYGPVTRYAIGHPSQTCTRTVERTRPWDSAVTNVALKRDQMGGPVVPSRVVVATMDVHVAVRDGTTLALTSGAMTSGSRSLYFVMAGVQGFTTGPHGSPWDQTGIGFAQNTPGLAGLVPRGSGWSSVGDDYMVIGTIQVHGTETYDDTETYECVSEVPNAPW